MAKIDSAASLSPEVVRSRSYARSWIDHLTSWVGALPGPSWAYYLVALLACIGIQAAAKWGDGTYPFGTLDPYHVVFASTAIYLVAALHYLDEVAEDALAFFRPALLIEPGQYEETRYKLTNLPAWPALFSTLVGPIYAVTSLLTTSESRFQRLQLYTSPVASVIDAFFYIGGWALVGLFVYHMIRQLRCVSSIYTRHTHINLFALGPLYAFSGLTARTAIILLFGAYAHYVTTPDLLAAAPRAVVILALMVLAALTAFALPLLGIHRLLVKEKVRLQSESAEHLQAAITKLHTRIKEGELTEMDQLKNMLEGLAIEQGVLDKIPTWPWQTETLRLLATALLLPIVLFLAERLLDSLLKF